ncbi:MAG: DNA-processing protein DprA [Spirochaetales bacterium]|nr:DNA-processing protein DprA [Spirochaetales bacterium]
MIHLLAINRIPNISARTKSRIASLSGSEEGFLRLCATPSLLLSCLDSNRGRSALEALGRSSAEDLCRKACNDQAFLSKKGIHVLSTETGTCPSLLAEIHDPPFLLYVMGNTASLSDNCIGVVGTRYPSGLAREAASASAKELCLNGCTVVSGLACGVDQCAHRGAVASGGKTVAVLGSGIDRIFPASGRRLISGIVEKAGALVSEYPPGTPPAKYRFPERNRIITGLSRAVLVIEAPKKSGSLITADFCIDYNRELFFHAAGVESAVGTGAFSYLKDGASYVRSARELLDAIGLPSAATVSYPKTLMDRLKDDLCVEEAA